MVYALWCILKCEAVSVQCTWENWENVTTNNSLAYKCVKRISEEEQVAVLKAVHAALCEGGVPEWRHLIQFLPVENHDRVVKSPRWTNLATRFTDSY